METPKNKRASIIKDIEKSMNDSCSGVWIGIKEDSSEVIFFTALECNGLEIVGAIALALKIATDKAASNK